MKSVIVLVLCLVAITLALPIKYHAPIFFKEEAKAIKDSWMVVFFNTSEDLRENHMQTLAKRIDASYESIGNTWNVNELFHGYHGIFTSNNLEHIRRDPIVKYVEQDSVVSLEQSCSTQNGAVWNLPRITGVTGTAFTYNSQAGAGVTAYVIDTGILSSHNDFGGRSTSPPAANFVPTESPVDCNGHGTHVAGTIAGTTYGIAKLATLVGVKVLGCSGSGTNVGVNSGINWAANDGRGKRCVLNLSLGGGFSQAQNDIMNAAAANCFAAVAAGNSNVNLQNTSPASASCTGPTWSVGATDINNAKASYSNFGQCLSVWAPGSQITSDWIGSNSATNTISGTSMASPAVAGVATLYWGYNAAATASAVRTALSGRRAANFVSGVPSGTPNFFIRLTCP